MSCSKRTYSFSGGSSNRLNFNNNNNNNNSTSGSNSGNNVPAKKKKKYNRATTFVPPTKFLLGGNIRDPLNLNGLQDEEETGDATAKICKDVALPALADFLLGGNINDPLNLKGIAVQETAAAKAAAAIATATTTIITTTAVTAAAADIESEANTCAGEGDEKVIDLALATVAGVGATAAGVLASCDDDDGRGDRGGDGGVTDGGDAIVAGTRAASAEICVSGTQKSDHCVNGAKVLKLNLDVNQAAAAAAVAAAVSADPRVRKLERKDKIVSPVIPQPYRPLKAVPFRQIITPDMGTKAQKTPKFKEKNTRFQYGNYQRYYGYRNAYYSGADLRLEILEKHRDFFENKDILDIGCNVGHVSFVVARSFGARSVTGIDIDRYLVDIAKRNVQYYVNCPSPYLSTESPSTAAGSGSGGVSRKVDLKYKCYPVSMPILYGPIYDDGDLRNESCIMFPKNVRFMHANYVLESEVLLQTEQPQYDTVLCLSVTKWIHLNWGDDGLKMAFKRMYAQLKPGGILILEPQSWDSYKRKKSLTETIWRNYRNIQLFPHHFDQYLLSSEVGFSRCQTLAVVNHQHKGFRRAIKVFKKPMPSVHSLGDEKVK